MLGLIRRHPNCGTQHERKSQVSAPRLGRKKGRRNQNCDGRRGALCECEFRAAARKTAQKLTEAGVAMIAAPPADRHAACRRRGAGKGADRAAHSDDFVHQAQLVTAQPGFSHWHRSRSRDRQMNVYAVTWSAGEGRLSGRWRRRRPSPALRERFSTMIGAKTACNGLFFSVADLAVLN